MLFEKNEPYISVFKTSAGEELVGKVVEETADAFLVEKARCLVVTPQGGVQFAPFLMMADSEKPIRIPKPVITAHPAESLRGSYEQSVSKIVLPPKGIIAQ